MPSGSVPVFPHKLVLFVSCQSPKAIYLRTAVEVRYSGMHLHGDKQVSSDSPKQRAGAITCSADSPYSRFSLILHVIWWSITVHCAVLCQETADRFPCQPRHLTSEVMRGSGLLGYDERMAEKKLVWRSWHQRSIPCFRSWTENHAEHPSNPLLKWNCWTLVGPCWTAVDCQSTRFSKTSPFSISLFSTTKCLSSVAFTQSFAFTHIPSGNHDCNKSLKVHIAFLGKVSQASQVLHLPIYKLAIFLPLLTKPGMSLLPLNERQDALID